MSLKFDSKKSLVLRTVVYRANKHVKNLTVVSYFLWDRLLLGGLPKSVWGEFLFNGRTVKYCTIMYSRSVFYTGLARILRGPIR